ncbi:MAG TPA: pyridoxamine 5'-phosphate oxidase family protein [Candidatus Dormibacteraeota bacterium]|nr:pyridoxamine 5'-phosphate oxidase family protein [Candidatus Dormibacteraeota bacterium]
MAKQRIQPELRAERPYMPGYEMMFRTGAKKLSWTWAAKRLSEAHNYWLTTVASNGKPHVMPVWGVWFDRAFYFSTGPRSKKARNIETNNHCVVCPENAKAAVILEGEVRRASPSDRSLRRVLMYYEKKYDWKMEGLDDSFYRIQPQKVFGILEDGASNPARWSFPRM